MEGIDILVWRRKRNMTQSTLAGHLGVSRATVINWERGNHRLPMNMASRLETIAYTLAPAPEKKPRFSVTPERRAAIMVDLNTRRPSFQLMTDEEKHVWFSNK